MCGDSSSTSSRSTRNPTSNESSIALLKQVVEIVTPRLQLQALTVDFLQLVTSLSTTYYYGIADTAIAPTLVLPIPIVLLWVSPTTKYY